MEALVFEIILGVILLLFVLYGFFNGFITTLGGLVGIVFGFWTATTYEPYVTEWLLKQYVPGKTFVSSISFLLIFIIASRLIAVLFYFIAKAFNIISYIPFTRLINRIFGAAFGFLEGFFALGLLLYFIEVHLQFERVQILIENSSFAAWLIFITGFLLPFLPEFIKRFGEA